MCVIYFFQCQFCEKKGVMSCLFCVTEPKFSTDFIFVQYSFYNFLQNKSCFYIMFVVIFFCFSFLSIYFRHSATFATVIKDRENKKK